VNKITIILPFERAIITYIKLKTGSDENIIQERF